MSNGRLVYSTGPGRLCPECARPLADCRCRRSKPAQAAGAARATASCASAARPRVARARASPWSRDVPLAGAALDELATRLKKRCGSGGTVHEGAIEIQGDHRDTLVAELGKLGYTVKRSGG